MLKQIIYILLLIISYSGFSQEKADLYYKARAAEFNKDNVHAVDYYSQYIFLDSSEYAIFLNRAANYFSLQEYQKALNDYSKSESLELGTGTYGMAKCYAMLNDKENALALLEKHLSQKEKHNQASIKLDAAFEKYHDTKEWKNIWLQEWYSKTETTIFDAEYMMSKGEYVNALDILDEFLAKKTRSHYAYYLRAMSSKALGNNKGAIADLSSALEISKKNDLYLYERANIYFMDKKYKKALEDYNKAIFYNSYDLKYFYNQMMVYYKLEEYDKALKDAELYLTYYPENDKVNYYSGLIYYAQEEMYKALEYVNYALKENTSEADYFLLRGNAYYQSHSYDLADKDFSMVLDLNPKIAEAFFFKGMCRFELGDEKGACQNWEKAFDLHYIDADEYLRKYCWKNN